MAEFVPFCGYRFDPAVAGDLGSVIAPPYDVIDGALRGMLYRQSEHNIARLTHADRLPGDRPYETAAKLWSEWRAGGVVKRDQQPSFYVYEQLFQAHGRNFSRMALLGLVRLKPADQSILPHEDTLTGPRVDRLDLLRATRTNFGPVFGLCPNGGSRLAGLLAEVKSQPCLVQATDRERNLHNLWTVSDPEFVRQVQEVMAGTEILIADGHHRLETAVAYAAENPNWPAAQYRLIALVNMADPGLLILPIHRCVKKVADFAPREFLERLRRHFDVRTYPGERPAVRNAVRDAMAEQRREGRHAIGLFLGDGNHYMLMLRREESLDELKGRSLAWRTLDVTILHYLILEKDLGITEERLRAESNIEYVHDFPHNLLAAAERVSSGQCQALFLLNPTPVDEVLAVARQHERMPQKTTFFYPKLYTGMVFYCMEG